MTEKQIQRIKKKIRSCRAQLSAEKRKYGAYDDGRGIRYIIPELYLKLEDYKGCLRYFNWFQKEFIDDCGFPDFLLQWTFVLFQNKKYDFAEKKLYETFFSNTYLIPLLIGDDIEKVEKSETISTERIEFAKEVIAESSKIITEDFIYWLKEISKAELFAQRIRDFIGLQKLIEEEPVGQSRTDLIRAEMEFVKTII